MMYLTPKAVAKPLNADSSVGGYIRVLMIIHSAGSTPLSLTTLSCYPARQAFSTLRRKSPSSLVVVAGGVFITAHFLRMEQT